MAVASNREWDGRTTASLVPLLLFPRRGAHPFSVPPPSHCPFPPSPPLFSSKEGLRLGPSIRYVHSRTRLDQNKMSTTRPFTNLCRLAFWCPQSPLATWSHLQRSRPRTEEGPSC